VIETHRLSPESHGALGIASGNLPESLQRGFILEGVEQRHGAVKRWLHRRPARNRKIYRAEVFRAVVMVLMLGFLRECWRNCQEHKGGKKVQPHFHIAFSELGLLFVD
jgi:hypothetical protein